MLKWRSVFLGFLACSVSFGQVAWNNDPAAANGPLSWGFLGGYNSFATCGTDKQAVGAKQTPIDISSKAAVPAEIPSLTFHYGDTDLVVENLGHVVEVVNENEESYLRVGPSLADKYKLLQFHFHTPSEHTIDGGSTQMELHLVHQNALGELAVVGVMLKADNAKANPQFDNIFLNAPYLGFAHTTAVSPKMGEINPEELLPEKRAYYTYTGSLTTPPCSEGVHWYVLTEPNYVSTQAVAIYQNLLKISPLNNYFQFNNRPVQSLNGRPVLVSK